jgi:hypothetical protein
MKQILIQCRLDGQVTTNIQYLTFDSENLTTKVTISYPSDYDTYTKRLDMFIGKDRTMDYKVGTTSSTFDVLLGEEHLKSGYLRLQPIANLIQGEDTLKVKWQVVEIKVKKSLNSSESTADIAIPLFDVLQVQIDTLDDDKMELDGSNSNLDILTFNASTLDLLTSIGQVRFNSTLKCLEVKITDNVTIQVGKELTIEATNKETSTIANGKACYISGGAGANAYCKFATTSDIDIAQRTIGLATENIIANARGHITVSGLVNDINTQAFEEGDIVYLSTNGSITNVEPVKPLPYVVLGVVLRQGNTNGVILVGVRVVPSLEQLSNVVIADLQDGDVLTYNATLGIWYNKHI